MYATTEALNCSAAKRQIRLHYTKDTTWYGGKPRPRPHCVRWGHSSPQKGHKPPIFGSCLLWPNGRPSQLLLISLLLFLLLKISFCPAREISGSLNLAVACTAKQGTCDYEQLT